MLAFTIKGLVNTLTSSLVTPIVYHLHFRSQSRFNSRRRASLDLGRTLLLKPLEVSAGLLEKLGSQYISFCRFGSKPVNHAGQVKRKVSIRRHEKRQIHPVFVP